MATTPARHVDGLLIVMYRQVYDGRSFDRSISRWADECMVAMGGGWRIMRSMGEEREKERENERKEKR